MQSTIGALRAQVIEQSEAPCMYNRCEIIIKTGYLSATIYMYTQSDSHPIQIAETIKFPWKPLTILLYDCPQYYRQLCD